MWFGGFAWQVAAARKYRRDPQPVSGGAYHEIVVATAAIAQRETGLGVLQDRVVAHAPSDVDVEVLVRCAAAAGGILLAGGKDASTGGKLRASGYDGPLLIDPELYRWGPEPEGLFGDSRQKWAEIQRDARVDAYLSPTLYVPVGDERRLEAALEYALGFRSVVHAVDSRKSRPPVITVLALGQGWLDDHYFSRLLRRIGRLRRPIGLVLEHSWDPAGTYGAVRNLATLARRLPALAVIRSDIAVIGALAHGAAMGAIGIRPTLRHLRRRSGGNIHDRSPRLVIPWTHRWTQGSICAELHDAGADLSCGCDTCGGRSLARFEDPATEPEAALHSIRTWQAAVHRIVGRPKTERPEAWGRECLVAIDRIQQLSQETQIPLPAPSYLPAWADLVGLAPAHAS